MPNNTVFVIPLADEVQHTKESQQLLRNRLLEEKKFDIGTPPVFEDMRRLFITNHFKVLSPIKQGDESFEAQEGTNYQYDENITKNSENVKNLLKQFVKYALKNPKEKLVLYSPRGSSGDEPYSDKTAKLMEDVINEISGEDGIDVKKELQQREGGRPIIAGTSDIGNFQKYPPLMQVFDYAQTSLDSRLSQKDIDFLKTGEVEFEVKLLKGDPDTLPKEPALSIGGCGKVSVSTYQQCMPEKSDLSGVVCFIEIPQNWDKNFDNDNSETLSPIREAMKHHRGGDLTFVYGFSGIQEKVEKEEIPEGCNIIDAKITSHKKYEGGERDYPWAPQGSVSFRVDEDGKIFMKCTMQRNGELNKTVNSMVKNYEKNTKTPSSPTQAFANALSFNPRAL